MPSFCHLHCHTQYSLLDGATRISEMMAKAKEDGMPAVALTDHGNMFGIYDFVNEAGKAGVKPIIGCEFYMVADRHKRSFVKSAGESDKRYHQLILAKNEQGYRNLCMLGSLGFTEGLYGKFPRIDKEILERYHEGLIATSCCLGAEIPQALLRGNIEEAERLAKWWLDLLGDDFYIELQRHEGYENIDETGVSQEDINQQLLLIAKKFNIKVIATNDVHYLAEDDAQWHDVLLAINTASDLDDESRFRFYSNDFFFKTQTEMGERFSDVPFALENTMHIVDKCYTPELLRDVMLPSFPLPEGFRDQYHYLHHLVYEGAKKRYGNISEQVRERIDYELSVLHDMNFLGYFLIVQDFVKAAKDLKVWVGPGRGSAAGSAVAYCLGITNIDPLKYNLLFERFLNPQRVSMPDIDIDFDDIGRGKVMDYVVKKYGQEQVAQIVTYGTMAARSSIRDVGRVSTIDLGQADRLAKMVPMRPGVQLSKILGDTDLAEFTSEERQKIEKLRDIHKSQSAEGEVLRTAVQVEGSVRSSGVHAAGVIIAPEDIRHFIPVCVQKDTVLNVTQVEGKVIEKMGLLKMDFLGLTTLSILRDAVENVVLRHGEDNRIDVDQIPLDDAETLRIFQEGRTTGLFQFESTGMRRYLQELRPTSIEDIIAMNALFRPGPMDNIPEFIDRKHGRKPIKFAHPLLEDILKPTYGIMVYQEQIMQAAQILAGFNLGDADILRRAMGKKDAKVMDKQREKFLEGCKTKGIDPELAVDIFNTMAKFAEYGFNRSHAAAYSILAFQTAWFKAHYPAEFMASVLTHKKSNISDLSFFLNECREMKIQVHGPDINESHMDFTVNKKGHIRFGLSALKGVGEGPVQHILEERGENGPFEDIFDMLKRLNSRFFNKKCFEALVHGGALDNLDAIHRAQYFSPVGRYDSYIEQLLRWASQVQASEESMQASLFGEAEKGMAKGPNPPEVEPWTLVYALSKEKAVAGIYFSGHPLDQYKQELKHLVSCSISEIGRYANRKIRLACMVSSVNHRVTRKGVGYGRFDVEDYSGQIEISLYKEKYLRFKDLFIEGSCLYVLGTYKKTWKADSDEMIFDVDEISLLTSAFDQYEGKIAVQLPLTSLSKNRIGNIKKTLKKHKGKQGVEIVVFDEEEELSLRLFPAKDKVNISAGLLEEMDGQDLVYKLIKK